MQVIHEVENYIKGENPLYLALGNFDGVHWGHKKLVSALLERARMDKGTAAAFIFEPHPSSILNPGRAPRLLVTAAQKAELLRDLGMDLLIYHSFTLEMARWSPEEFVRRVLMDRLRVKEVFVGFNYSFGHKGAGTPEMLKSFGEKYGFAVHIIPPVTIDGEVVSSTLVRSCLEEGNIEKAAKLLGYNPFLEGRVVKGDRRGGALLGFPTANLQVDQDIIVPAKGVYVVRAAVGGRSLPAVANIGNVPTFLTGDVISVEAHILDFQGDLYGQELRLEFYKKLRDEKKFASADQLIAQIGRDVETARAFFG